MNYKLTSLKVPKTLNSTGAFYFLELQKRHNSKVVRCDSHTHTKVRGKGSKVVEWPWKIFQVKRAV